MQKSNELCVKGSGKAIKTTGQFKTRQGKITTGRINKSRKEIKGSWYYIILRKAYILAGKKKNINETCINKIGRERLLSDRFKRIKRIWLYLYR